MATLHRIVVYLVDVEDSGLAPADIQEVLQDALSPCFIRVSGCEEVDLGEIDENHALANPETPDADFEKYFLEDV